MNEAEYEVENESEYKAAVKEMNREFWRDTWRIAKTSFWTSLMVEVVTFEQTEKPEGWGV